jgi:valyl-tRNA synthetase
MRYSSEKITAMRNFANKIWNASRFLLMNLTIDECKLPETLELEDKWILSKLNTLVKEVTDNLESYEMGIAAQKLYDFTWNSFCDWFIELAKIRLNGEDEVRKTNVQQVLCYVLTNILKLLHPFMPFITEEIYQALPHDGDFLMMQQYPVYDEALNFAADEATMEKIMEAIRAVRECRAELKVPNSKKAHVTIVSTNTDIYETAKSFLIRLASASEVTVLAEETEALAGMVSVVTADAKMFLPLAELVNLDDERARIQKELDKAYKELEFVNNKLNNEKFMAKAPEKVVAGVRESEAKAKALIQKLEEQMAALK